MRWRRKGRERHQEAAGNDEMEKKKAYKERMGNDDHHGPQPHLPLSWMENQLLESPGVLLRKKHATHFFCGIDLILAFPRPFGACPSVLHSLT